MVRKDIISSLTVILSLALIWGSSFILIKRGLEVFSPYEVASIRVASAFLFLLPFALKKMSTLTVQDHIKLLASGLMGIGLPALLFSIAQLKINSSVTGIMNSLMPIWTMFVGLLFFSHRFNRYAVLGALIGFVGASLLIVSNSSDLLGGMNSYAFFILLATFLYGCNTNFIKHKINHLDAVTIASISTIIIGPLAFVYLATMTDWSSRLAHGSGGWEALGFVILLGAISTAGAVPLFIYLIKKHSPLVASAVTYLIPIVATLWGLFDGEVLGSRVYGAMATIMVGVYLVNRYK